MFFSKRPRHVGAFCFPSTTAAHPVSHLNAILARAPISVASKKIYGKSNCLRCNTYKNPQGRG
jgi:hypothetical protein